jgi:transcriptional antiterminator RfaH
LNLEPQGDDCFLPTCAKKKVSQTALELVTEPLFSRYLFISLDTDLNSKSWSPIRSTLDVSKLVIFGSEPAKVHHHLITQQKDNETNRSCNPQSPFQTGDIVTVFNGAFAGIKVVYQMDDGEASVMVLIELLHRPTRMGIPITNLQCES